MFLGGPVPVIVRIDDKDGSIGRVLRARQVEATRPGQLQVVGAEYEAVCPEPIDGCSDPAGIPQQLLGEKLKGGRARCQRFENRFFVSTQGTARHPRTLRGRYDTSSEILNFGDEATSEVADNEHG